MKDLYELDLFLVALRQWVIETTGNGPNAKCVWFRRQVYEAFPGFVLWGTKSGQYQIEETQPKRSLRLVH